MRYSKFIYLTLLVYAAKSFSFDFTEKKSKKNYDFISHTYEKVRSCWRFSKYIYNRKLEIMFWIFRLNKSQEENFLENNITFTSDKARSSSKNCFYY